MMRGLIVAIDGPSGAGKSSVTSSLAERLGYLHIDTGAMYRALALLVSRAGADIDDEAGLEALCRDVSIEFCRQQGFCRILLNGEDVTSSIRTPEISMLTSRLAARRVVRDILLQMQRRLGASGGVVLEGRDIGTIVFPDAEVKFFLTATPEERGRRRYLELAARGENVMLEETIEQVRERDHQDQNREIAPLVQAPDALVIDSTGRDPESIVSEMVQIVTSRQAGGV